MNTSLRRDPLRQSADVEAAGGFRSQQLRSSRAIADIGQDARECLLVRPRSMPPKYFYDRAGSRLFEKICETPEYYPTRTESALLRAHARRIMSVVEAGHLVEFGSGSSIKTRWLLDAWDAPETGRSAVYHPVDVSADMLLQSGRKLASDYPWLEVCAHVGDYHGGLVQLEVPTDHRRLALFLGGTIGNFSPTEAHAFLAELHDWLRPGDALLIGADRVKSVAELERAYNDSEGVTAEFNLNLLAVLNRELGADFDPGRFRHEAIYNADASQIEMYLVSNCEQRVELSSLGSVISLEAGERILTEISRKFTHETLESALTDSGFRVTEHFECEAMPYSLVLASV